MCEPMAIVSAALALGGTILQQKGRQEAQEAQDRAAARSSERQDGLRREADALFRNSLEQTTAQNVDEMTKRRTDQRAQSLLPPELTTAAAPRDGESAAVAGAGAASNKNALDDLQTQGLARAELGGQRDAFRDLAAAVQPNADKIARTTTSIGVEQANLPMRLAAAGRAGGGLRDIGSLVSGLGNIGASAAGAGAFDEGGVISNTVSDGWSWVKDKVNPPTPLPAFTPGGIW
jgi:hypothetical protein